MQEKRLPARDGKTPSNYVVNSKGETWYKPLPIIPKTPPKPQETKKEVKK